MVGALTDKTFSSKISSAQIYAKNAKKSVFALHIGDPHIRVAPKLEFWGPPLFFDTNRFASFGFYCGPPIGRGPRVVVQASLLQNIHQGRRNGPSAYQIAEAMLRNLINS